MHEGFVSRAEEESGPELAQAIHLLVEQVEEWLNTNPVNMQIFKPMQPQLRILESGELENTEVRHDGISDSITYVDEVARGLEYNDTIYTGKVAGTDVTAGIIGAVGFESTLNDNSSMSSDEQESDEDDDDDDEESVSVSAKRESERSQVSHSSKLRFGLDENMKKIVVAMDSFDCFGAIIGWMRGTGFMSDNNVVAAGVEKMGMRTFSTTEMSFILSALMHPSIVDRAAESPIFAGLTGGMAQVSDLKDQVDSIRADIMKKSKLQVSIHAALENDKKLLALPSKQPSSANNSKKFALRANMSGYYCCTFPKLSGVAELANSSRQTLLRNMLDLRKIVVVAGFGGVSP
ncbi:3-oxoacyl-[acyl-carrier-protein] synthase [Phytophthora boehmeriae]|uniref:3-oxoacyl-[acyl-carrier-protein] synthase n=1 Tax=Phytophthora boehmeriae TaxID=109152 RepID=A0A8T1X078_9STRA|nr:3-oxoacyl-[acyl-carrier-protein] synthase [Phytophthora boehmeriae]